MKTREEWSDDLGNYALLHEQNNPKAEEWKQESIDEIIKIQNEAKKFKGLLISLTKGLGIRENHVLENANNESMFAVGKELAKSIEYGNKLYKAFKELE